MKLLSKGEWLATGIVVSVAFIGAMVIRPHTPQGKMEKRLIEQVDELRTAAPGQVWVYLAESPFGIVSHTNELLVVSNGWAITKDTMSGSTTLENLGLFPGWKRLK